jgi:hypothetical protein
VAKKVKIEFQNEYDEELDKVIALEEIRFPMTDGSTLVIPFGAIFQANTEINKATKVSRGKDGNLIKRKTGRILTKDEVYGLYRRDLVAERR